MKQTLVIGSTVIDVFLNIPNIPRRGQDINISASEYRLGGCAYNVYKILRLFNSPALLCSPVGTGNYGRMVREYLEKEGLQPFVSIERENGCCYCIIESDGERTFLSHHGAEYLFSRLWMKDVDFSQSDGIFICGIELEEETADEIVDFVFEHPELELYFSPGPRIMNISPERMKRLLDRRDKSGKGPLLHLNEYETVYFSGEGSVEKGALSLSQKTENSVIVTLGERGCYCLEKAGLSGHFFPAVPAKVVDTVGAGDAHFGALIACLKQGKNLKEACHEANRIAAARVSIKGAVPDSLDKLPIA